MGGFGLATLDPSSNSTAVIHADAGDEALVVLPRMKGIRMLAPADPGAMITLLRRLRATRSFRPDPVPQPALDDILDVARWTGSARNIQPWELILVDDRDTLRQLSATPGATAGHLASAPMAIFIVMPQDYQKFEAYDTGRLAERLMLAAAVHGLGSCIGMFSAPEAMSRVRAALSIPEDHTMPTVISLGYPDRDAPRRTPPPDQPRKPLVEFVYRGRYGAR